MRIIVYIIVGIILFIIFAAIVDNPMDDSGQEFNGNIFPFEIKDPKDWFKSKDNKKDNNQNNKDNKDQDKGK